MQDSPIDTPDMNRTDVVSGIVVVAASLGFAWLALGYGVGTVRQMGAGFFPLALGIVGTVLGAAVIVRAITDPQPQHEAVDIRRFLFVAAAFVVFALGIEPAGVFPTVVATAMIASLAHRDSRLWESFLLGLGLAIAIWLIFVVLLVLPLPLWPLQR